MSSIKNFFRNRLIACKPCYKRYRRLKYRIENLRDLTFYIYELRSAWRYMHWGKEVEMTPAQLQAKLLFYYHKIEKGICMPGKKRLFALEVIPEVTTLLKTWEVMGNSKFDPVYIGAINSLRSYQQLIAINSLDPDGKISAFVDSFLSNRVSVSSEEVTPIEITKHQIGLSVSYDQFKKLCELRRSFRDFSDQTVSPELIRQAVELAQLSPSACNRQPCKVYAIQDNALKKQLLEHQNGNAGFGHLAPILLVLTADSSHFFGAIERNQPYIDGGLFAMSLQYALQVQGLVSCCLNWCVTPKTDERVHQILDIPDSERITMFMVLGFPKEQTKVPKSYRKQIDDVLSFK